MYFVEQLLKLSAATIEFYEAVDGIRTLPTFHSMYINIHTTIAGKSNDFWLLLMLASDLLHCASAPLGNLKFRSAIA